MFFYECVLVTKVYHCQFAFVTLPFPLPLQAFKEELENLIQEQQRKGSCPSGLLALRQIADFFLSSSVAGFSASSLSE